MKVSIAIAAYFGERGERTHTQYKKDYLFFVKTHLDNIKKIEDKFHKIYFVCTTDSHDKDENVHTFFYQEMEENPKIEVLTRPNLGGSYAGWHNVLEFDNNDSDYMVFIEDDYALTDIGVDAMLEYYKETPDVIYLCQLWNRNRYVKDGVDIAEHAQVSNGMINVKLYNKLKEERGLDFTLYYFPGKTAIYNNQASFLEQYRSNGIPIRDMSEKYTVMYQNDEHSVINFGKRDGVDVFKPINDWYPNQCPNLRFNW
jgi:hypothetical protein